MRKRSCRDFCSSLQRESVTKKGYKARPCSRSCYILSPLAATGPRIHEGADPSIKTTVTAMHDYGKYLTSVLPKFIQQFSVYKDELTIYVAPNALLPVMEFLRDHTNAQF